MSDLAKATAVAAPMFVVVVHTQLVDSVGPTTSCSATQLVSSHVYPTYTLSTLDQSALCSYFGVINHRRWLCDRRSCMRSLSLHQWSLHRLGLHRSECEFDFIGFCVVERTYRSTRLCVNACLSTRPASLRAWHVVRCMAQLDSRDIIGCWAMMHRCISFTRMGSSGCNGGL